MKNFLAVYDDRDDYSVAADTAEDAMQIAIRETHALPIGIIPDSWSFFSGLTPQQFADDQNMSRSLKALGNR